MKVTFFFWFVLASKQCCDVIGNGMGREGKGKGFLMIGSFSSSNERYMYIHIVYVKKKKNPSLWPLFVLSINLMSLFPGPTQSRHSLLLGERGGRGSGALTPTQ